ncbi:MAG: MBOAT family O-acyltransferase [Bulleidia sp.]|nr:MBOAT family O-acyltransferase [Bulleidia sp.]
MLFSSVPFLYWFLPCVLILYAIVPRILKNTILLLSSLFFYGYGEPRYVIWIVVAIILAYIFGLLIERYETFPQLSKLFLVLSVISSITMLGYFKYANFFIQNINAVTGISLPLLKITLPIGISFYTFQILSYTVDVYRKNVKAQKNIIDLATYVALFPQLIAGPIVRYADIAEQLKNRKHSIDKISAGISRFIIGLSKKILIANLLGELCTTFKASNEKSVLFFWLYAVAYSLHIYFDFSGYSDMAIGLGKIFGFTFLENFNYPFISNSITEFWRRWHMSLGSWFRDYVYIPLGGNRKGKNRQLLNIFIVWMLTGFWHGASWNFIIWGLYFAVLLIIEKLWFLKYLQKSRVLSHIYVIIATVISFVIFDATNMSQAFDYIKAMFLGSNYPLISNEFIYYFHSYYVILIFAIIGSTPLPNMIWNCYKRSYFGKKISIFIEPVVLVILLIICTAFLVDGSYNPFLYFRF